MKLLCVMYLSVWVTSPFLAYGNLYRTLALLSVIVWSFLEMFEKRSVFWKPTSYILVLFGFLIYTLPISYFSDGISGLNRNIQFFIMLYFLVIYASYKRKSLWMLKPVIYLNIVLFTIWMYTTYRGLLLDPHACRYVVKSNAYAEQLTRSGVGGFAFIYSLLIYIVGVLALVKHRIRTNKLWRPFTIFMIFSALFGILIVLKAGYSIAVLLLVISLAIFFLHSDSLQKNLILYSGLIIFIIIFKLYLLDVLKLLYDFVEQGSYQLKLQDAILSLTTEQTEGAVADRIERYSRSLGLFLDHPLSGVWSIASVGKHSLLLDTFAQYGLFAGMALIYILFRVPFSIYRKVKREKSLVISASILIFLLPALNNVAMAFGFTFYIFYPYVVAEVDENDV